MTARLTTQIPEPHERLVLYHGLYQWATLIRKVWQENPLLCPRCGGTMRIISFITDQTVIDKILRHIAFKHADAPPERYHPSPQVCRSPLG